MNKSERITSKEVGLEIGLLIGRFFLRTDDLHYGYWPNGQGGDITNFATAQENYSNFVLCHVPAETKTILDVGAGAGNLARKLLAQGFAVDCVSPSEFLSGRLREKLGDTCYIYNCKYEDLQTEKQYDLILFSESFQYVNMEKGLQQCQNLLRDRGYVLICDFFKTDAKGKSPLGGGHKLSRFFHAIAHYPFKKIEDIDITKETAPTIDILDRFLGDVAKPVTDFAAKYLLSNYPKLMKILTWKFRQRIDKLNRRYLSGRMNAEAYLKHKTYRLLLFRKTKV